MKQNEEILLLTADPQRAKVWQAWLATAGRVGKLSGDCTHPFIIVIDSAGKRLLKALRNQLWIDEQISSGEIGLIRIGCTGPGDAQLQANPTQQQFLLACKLVTQIISLRRELAIQKQHQRLLRSQAETDPLTGLPNRRAWNDMLKQKAAADASGPSAPGVLVLMDIDHFKAWNKNLGHAGADELLVEVAKRISSAIRSGDFIARWGGDEFALMLPNLPLNLAATIVERIRAAARFQVAKESHENPDLNICAGWAPFVYNYEDSAAQAFTQADAALKSAKAAGRDCTRPLSPDATSI